MVEVAAVVGAVGRLARLAHRDVEADDVIVELARCALAGLGADAAAVRRPATRVRTATTRPERGGEPAARALAEFLAAGDGSPDCPAAAAATAGAPVAVADLAHERRWPAYRAEVARLGYTAVLAVPVVVRGDVRGVLEVYRQAPGAWAAGQVASAALLAEVAAGLLLAVDDREASRDELGALAHRAMHDELTGLANRALLIDRLEHALAVATRRGSAVAVVFLDLDRFKAVNDTYGHTAGDAVIVEVARRLAATVRGDDTLARFGGDEFVVACEGLPDDTGEQLALRVGGLVDRLREALRPPVLVGGTELPMTASIGVAVARGRRSAHDLIGEADRAMYRAKNGAADTGPPAQLQRTGERTAAAPGGQSRQDLDRAVERGQLRLHYQPIVAAADRALVAVEALLRWSRPGEPVLPAGVFLDLAVGSGAIRGFGHWVLGEACRQLADWRVELGDDAPDRVFVNLSVRELGDPDLGEVLAAALARHGLQPRDLGLEIVDHGGLDREVVDRLIGLRASGHPLAVDDFGAGHTVLTRLLELPADVLKIDRNLIGGLPGDRRQRGLLDGVLQMAANLDLDVVAEGVETAAEAAYLSAAGCRLLQGIGIAPPADPAELGRLWAGASAVPGAS